MNGNMDMDSLASKMNVRKGVMFAPCYKIIRIRSRIIAKQVSKYKEFALFSEFVQEVLIIRKLTKQNTETHINHDCQHTMSICMTV